MRSCLVLLGILAASRTARADAYAWGGSSGRLRVDVTVAGFNEGAGEGGWSEEGARDFAAVAMQFNTVVPEDAFVWMQRDVSDDNTTLLITQGPTTMHVLMPGGPDFDRALAFVAAHFRVAVPPRAAARLFTIQLFASRTETGASQLAAGLDASHLEVDGSFFYEACLPCQAREARVTGPQGGFYRVIAGVFDDRGVAERSRRALQRRTGHAAFVREL